VSVGERRGSYMRERSMEIRSAKVRERNGMTDGDKYDLKELRRKCKL